VGARPPQTETGGAEPASARPMALPVHRIAGAAVIAQAAYDHKRTRGFMTEIGRDLTELTDAESLALLGSVSLGRIVFTMRALPTVRPVSHILDNGHIVIRSHMAAAIVSQADSHGAVVAYEADDLDPVERLGWGVSITGTARILRDADRIERYRQQLSPWVTGQKDDIIAILPELICGFRLISHP
jgi:hypothetical protein